MLGRTGSVERIAAGLVIALIVCGIGLFHSSAIAQKAEVHGRLGCGY